MNPIGTILRQLGFTWKFQPLTGSIYQFFSESQANFFTSNMNHYGFRLFIKDLIACAKSDPATSTPFLSRQKYRRYQEQLVSMGILRASGFSFHQSIGEPIRYSDTFLDFLVRHLELTFSIPSLANLRILGLPDGGDFDIICLNNHRLIALEIKSSPPSNIHLKNILSFLKRTFHLPSWYHVFFVDTTLRLEDKILPLFEEAIFLLKGADTFLTHALYPEKENIYRIPPNLFIINSSPNLNQNLTCLFRLI